MYIRTEKAFTLIEMMIVIVIISILSIMMLTNYRMFIQNTKEKKVRSDLQTIKKGILIYKNRFGKWPDDPGEVVDRGLVNWDASNRKYQGKLVNDFGYTYDLYKDISGHRIRTFFDDPRKGKIEIYEKFTPPYKASKNAFTFFYHNFEQTDNGEFLSDYPTRMPPYDQNNVYKVPGYHSLGSGGHFDNGYVIYEKRPDSFSAITIEFWAKFNSANPRGNIVHIAGKKDFDTREIRLYFDSGTPRFCGDITTLHGDADFTDFTLQTWIWETNNLSFNTTDWYHFAFVYSYDRNASTSYFKLYMNGTEVPSSNPLAFDGKFFPMELSGSKVNWEPFIYIGTDRDASGNDLQDVVLDNLMLSYTAKNAGDFKP